MGKSVASRHAPEEIDAYLAALPDDVRTSLERVRTIIRATAPDCTERISYKIPIFRLGKDLVGISAQKNHCAPAHHEPCLDGGHGRRPGRRQGLGCHDPFYP